jgi:GGDEF domain-containing protein
MRRSLDDVLLTSSLADVTRQHILETLRQCGGNRTWAARELGLSLRGLRLKVKHYAGDDGLDFSHLKDGSFDRFNLLPSPIAVLDFAGFIVSTNAAWERTAVTGGLNGPSCRLNYFSECDSAVSRGCIGAERIVRGLRSIANDERDEYSHIYECPFGGKFHWFQVEAVSSHARGAVVVHTNLNLLEHDPETDLPNDRLFQAQAQYSLGEAVANGWSICLCVVTLTETERAASIFGPEAVSSAMQEVARRLKMFTGSQHFLARTRPTEFAVLHCSRSGDPSRPQTPFLKIMLALREPIVVAPHITGISAKVGFSSYPSDGADYAGLMNAARANDAMIEPQKRAERCLPH